MKRLLMGLWFVVALPLTVAAQEGKNADTTQFKGDFIYLRDYGSEEIGYLVVPQDIPRAGLVLVSDGHGVDTWMKITADFMAQQGYLVLALDLYNGNTTTEAQQAARMENDLMEQGVLNALKTATVFYRQSPRFKMNKVFIIGLGPMSNHLVTFAAQKNLALNGLVIINPAKIPTVERLRRMRYPVLLQFGKNATAAVESAERLVKDGGVQDWVEIKTAAKLDARTRRIDAEQWRQITEFIRKNSTEERRRSLVQRIFAFD
jgi:dienelactone hydrolase